MTSRFLYLQKIPVTEIITDLVVSTDYVRLKRVSVSNLTPHAAAVQILERDGTARRLLAVGPHRAEDYFLNLELWGLTFEGVSHSGVYVSAEVEM